MYELLLDYECIDVGGVFGGVDMLEFKVMNLNGMIFVIEDGLNDFGDMCFVLWEFNVIVCYFLVCYGLGNFYLFEFYECVDVDCWMDW